MLVTSFKVRLFAFFLALFTLIAVGQFQTTPAQASHLRGSLVTVEYHAADAQHPNEEVHLQATTLARKTAPASMTFVQVYRVTGTNPITTSPVVGCSGTNTPIINTDTSNPLFEISTTTFTITGCFATAGDYIFEAWTSARIAGILNTTNLAIQFQAMVHVDHTHDTSSPIFNAGYMYNIAYDANLSYSTNLGGLGQGNTPVTYELVTSAQSGLDGYGASRVPCSDLNTSTGAYRINSSFCNGSESIASAFGGGPKYYALKVRATDATGQYSTRDVLLYFDTTTNQPPVFTSTPNASAFTVAPGTSSTVQFCGQDPDVNDVLNFTYSPTRSWITAGAVTTLSPATTPNTYCITYTLAPPVGTSEAFNFEVSIYDNNLNFVRSASGIYSFQAGASLPGAGPVFSYSPSTYNIIEGASLTVPVPIQTGGSPIVSYSISPALPVGLTFNTADGSISGQTYVIRSVTYTVSGTDAQNAVGTATITIAIGAAPEPKGPVVVEINPRNIEVGHEQEITITGLRLKEAKSLIVRGLPIGIKLNNDTSIVFVLPAQTEEGFADLSFKTPEGSLTWESALRFFKAKVHAPAPTNSMNFVVSGFAGGSSAITPEMRLKITYIAKQLKGASSVSCTGFTMGPTVLKKDAKLSFDRSSEVCSILKKLVSNKVAFSIDSQQETKLGAHVRRVEIQANF